MLVTVLHRMSGQEAPEYDGAFSDVSPEDPFAGAVAWALQAGIVTGTEGERGSWQTTGGGYV